MDAMPTVEFAGITMLDEKGKPGTTVFTDEESPQIDAAQYESGRGPCLSAWRTKQSVRLDDVRVDGLEYPEFSQAAVAHGILSTLSLPLVAGGKGLGALNLYASSAGAFSDEDAELCGTLADAASVVLANAVAYWDVYQLSEHMQTAMQSRAIIEQAKGMLMAQSPKLTADDAFDVLVKASQRENVKLRQVAQRIVDRRVPPPAGW